MSEFGIELADRTFNGILIPHTLRLKPTRWRHTSRGGPESCTVAVEGSLPALWEVLRWLRYDLRVRSPNGQLVWWGFVNDVMLRVGGLNVGLTLDNMYNYVCVLHSFDDVDGVATDGRTDMATANDSAGDYGRKELQYTGGQMDETAAEKLRDTILSWVRYPIIQTAAGRERVGATINCRGYWETLGWRYYEDTSGKITQEEWDERQYLSWRLTTSDIAFTASDKRIYHLGTSFDAIPSKAKIIISDHASNNGTYTVSSTAGYNDGDQLSYTSSTIRFEAAEQIADDDTGIGQSGFGFLENNDFIKVSGSSGGSNDRYWRLNEAEADHLVTQKWWGYNIVTQSHGASVTIQKMLAIAVNEPLNNGYPGDSCTLSMAGQKVAQKFVNSIGTWTANEVMLCIRKESGPTDAVKVELCADSAGAPGTVLASQNVNASDIGTELTWKRWAFASPTTLSVATSYWLVISRTTTPTDGSFFEVAVDTELSYGDGVMRLWDGSAWVVREEDADLAFQVWGTRENTTQVRDMILASEFMTGVDIENTSGVATRHWRDGYTTALDEINALLEQGTSSGGRIMATVTPERRVRIFTEPTQTEETGHRIGTDGRLYTSLDLPVSAGVCPVGQWAWIPGVPVDLRLHSVSPIMMDAIEYDSESGDWYVEPRGAPTHLNMPTHLIQG